MQPLVAIFILGVVTVALFIYGIFQFAVRRKTILAQRVETYTAIEEQAAIATAEEFKKTSPATNLFNLLFGRGYIQKIEESLARADVPMRASEFILLRTTLALAAFLVGYFQLGYLHSAIVLAAVGYLAPALFVQIHEERRRAKFVTQLADALLLLTNSLRAGYSFFKGLELVAEEMDDPIAKELKRVLHEVNLGTTIDQALQSLAKRIKSQDLDIVVSAYLVQKDVGGNLNEIIEKVAETIRERLRIQGDIKVLTAQGRLSGMVVGFLPLIVGLVIFLKNPDYFAVLTGAPYLPFFGWNVPYGALMLVAAFCLQIIGAFVIYRIVSIKI